MQTKLLSIEASAEKLGVSVRSLADRRYRVRVGLAGVRVGRRLLFAEQEIEKLIERGREHLPGGEGRRWANFLLARCYAFVYVSLRDALTPDLSTLRFLLRLIASALELLH